MLKWPHNVSRTNRLEIQEHCMLADWQRIRLSMKGEPTAKKLDMLDAYRTMRIKTEGKLLRVHEVQVDNYINALKRGGQLNDNLEVVK